MRRSFLMAWVVLLVTSAVSQSQSNNHNRAHTGLPPDSTITEGYFIGANDVRLFYRKVGSGKDAVVFLHGGPGANFRGSGDYMEPLAARRTLIMHDQRGSGRSELVTDPSLLTIEHHVGDLEKLRQHFGIKRMTLIGLSWGSGLAGLYAAKHPERVERLLLISPISPTRRFFNERLAKLNSVLGAAAISRRNAIREKIGRASDAKTVALCRELSDITFRLYLVNPTTENLRHAALRCEIAPAAIRNRYVVEAATIASLGEWDFRPMLARLRMPALIMEGAKTNVPLDATREWVAVMPNARLLLIPEAGHEFFVDQPAAFLKAAETFLRGRFPKEAEVVRKSGDAPEFGDFAATHLTTALRRTMNQWGCYREPVWFDVRARRGCPALGQTFSSANPEGYDRPAELMQTKMSALQ